MCQHFPHRRTGNRRSWGGEGGPCSRHWVGLQLPIIVWSVTENYACGPRRSNTVVTSYRHLDTSTRARPKSAAQLDAISEVASLPLRDVTRSVLGLISLFPISRNQQRAHGANGSVLQLATNQGGAWLRWESAPSAAPEQPHLESTNRTLRRAATLFLAPQQHTAARGISEKD